MSENTEQNHKTCSKCQKGPTALATAYITKSSMV